MEISFQWHGGSSIVHEYGSGETESRDWAKLEGQKSPGKGQMDVGKDRPFQQTDTTPSVSCFSLQIHNFSIWFTSVSEILVIFCKILSHGPGGRGSPKWNIEVVFSNCHCTPSPPRPVIFSSSWMQNFHLVLAQPTTAKSVGCCCTIWVCWSQRRSRKDRFCKWTRIIQISIKLCTSR